MKLTIKDAAAKANLTPHTIRYYDKEGLLPFVERTKSGIRYFSERDLEALNIINCLKATSMPIKDIKVFINWCLEGDETIKERYEMFLERRAAVQQQIKDLEYALETIDYKCWYYKEALDAGTLKVHDGGLDYIKKDV